MITKVKLRQKPISGGRQSLYLDFYPAIPDPNKPGKTTRREFLRLYLFDKPRNPIDKKHNKETLLIAQSIRQKKENQLNKPEIYDHYEKEQLRLKEMREKDFIEYFTDLAKKRTGSTNHTWMSALNYIKSFFGDQFKFGELDTQILDEFKEYLLLTKSIRSEKMTLARNTAVSYFGKLKAALKQAYKDGILEVDLNARVDPIKEEDTRREFLLKEELTRLIKVECQDDTIKRAAIFSALTSLAHQEIVNLTWKDVTFFPDKGYQVLSKRQKTERDNYLPITEQAYEFTLGDIDPRKMPKHEKIFKGLKYSTQTNKVLQQWMKDANIDKHITFHCFRHTYAILQLASGTDIYAVSKMMGHKSIKTTEIYANILDETKRQAANRLKLDI